MTRRKAPKGFSSSKIELAQIRAGALWFRLFSSIYKDPLGFGLSPSRFSDPRIDLPEADRFGVIYLGTSLKVCFLEKVLRDRRNGRLGDIPIPYAELEQLVCAELRTALPLKLIDLRGDRLLQMGSPNRCGEGFESRFGTELVARLLVTPGTARRDHLSFATQPGDKLSSLRSIAGENRIIGCTTVPRESSGCGRMIREFRLAIV